MEWKAKWIKPNEDMGEVAPVFSKTFFLAKAIKRGTLYLTALGVYEAVLNDCRVGEFVLAPGWSSYIHRLQYQSYDVTDMLNTENRLIVTVGKGWYRSRLPGERQKELKKNRRQFWLSWRLNTRTAHFAF